ncbi:MAG: 3-deoxy-7-phosphoheptulonate synthase [Bacteroidetes bacterium]|nr:3-deoxy-7-phosphoheptulonate synthase [Bacteroidota bacterium]
MIVHLKKDADKSRIEAMAEELKATILKNGELTSLITSSSLKELNGEYEGLIDETFIFDTDIQLAHSDYHSGHREIKLGDNYIGGKHKNTLMISGPCSVESREQITRSAELCVELGISVIRGGCYKPRTSPYSFQGLGLEGLKLLVEVREKYGLLINTEVKDATHVDEVIEYTDIIQIGAKAMYDHGILNKCGKTTKPVILKRGFGTTLQEFVQAAEFMLSGGNPNIILCERGIRTFETKSRFTLDLCGVAYLKENTNLPIILDPSHAMGFAYGVPDLARACMAMGVEGLLIEVHPDPSVAKSDASQQLDFDTFRKLYASLGSIATAIGRKLI